jgi:hypothetical protein
LGAAHRSPQAISAADLKWAPVPTLSEGAQIAVIEGPMNQAVRRTRIPRWSA